MTMLEYVSQYICNRDGDEEEVRQIGLDCLADTFGCMLLGCMEQDPQKVIRYVRRNREAGQAWVYCRNPFRTDVQNAAFANAVAAHNCDYDDMTTAGCGHPSVPVFPVALALGEQYHKSGRQVLDSYITGMEVSMRLGQGTLGGALDLAWNPTTVMGIFGATAAAAKLMELNEEQTCAALGMAACEAGGTKGNYGTGAKNITVGHLCMKGIRCAELAQEGIRAAVDGFEAENGFISCYGKSYDVEAGKRAFLERISFLKVPGIIQKPYPTCRSNHSGIDGALWIHKSAGYRADQIDRVECFVDPASARLDRCQLPSGPEEAKFSTAYCVALGLLYGTVGVEHFLCDSSIDPEARELAGRIQVTESLDFPEHSSFPNRLRVYFRNGCCQEYLGEYGKGDPRAALTKEERKEKFNDCLTRICGGADTGDIFQRLNQIEAYADVCQLTEWIRTRLAVQKGDDRI